MRLVLALVLVSNSAMAIPLQTLVRGDQTVFSLRVAGNGFAPGTVPSGIPAPAVEWWADDHLGAGGITSHAFTAVGSTEEVDTPFCPDGSWSDLSSGCLKARHFDGANDAYTADSAAIGVCGTGDCSFFAVIRLDDNSANDTVASNIDVGNEGWKLHRQTNSCRLFVEESGGTNASDIATVTGGDSEWLMCGGSLSNSGNVTAYGNGDAGTPSAGPGGNVISNTERLTIGALRTGTATFALGDIVVFMFWNQLLTDAHFRSLFNAFAGIDDSKGSAVTFTNSLAPEGFYGSPPVLWSFSDDWPLIGNVVPPGLTGAGSPADGVMINDAATNSILYSRDIDTGGWTSLGGLTIDCSPGSWPQIFGDNRTVCRLEDSNPGVSQHMHQTVDITALGTGSGMAVCVYAGADDESQAIDISISEQTGVGCTPSDHDMVGESIASTGTMVGLVTTVSDGDCEEVEIHVAPVVDHDVGSQQGHAYPIVMFVQNWTGDECPGWYIETEASGVTAGDGELYADATNITDATGMIVDGTTISIDVTRSTVPFAGDYLLLLKDTATGGDYWYAYLLNETTVWMRVNSAEDAGEEAVGTWTVTAGTVGVARTFEFVMAGNAAGTSLKIDGVLQTNTAVGSIASTPNSLDRMYVMNSSGTAQPSAWVSDIEVTR